MRTIRCRSCGRSTLEGSVLCPSCGGQINQEDSSTGPTRAAPRINVATVVAFMAVVVALAWWASLAFRTSEGPGSGLPPPASSSLKVENCTKSPADLFPVGQTFESKDLSALQDKYLKNVSYSPDMSFRVTCFGSRYVVQTAKVDDNDPSHPAYYKIVSVQAQ